MFSSNVYCTDKNFGTEQITAEYILFGKDALFSQFTRVKKHFWQFIGGKQTAVTCEELPLPALTQIPGAHPQLPSANRAVSNTSATTAPAALSLYAKPCDCSSKGPKTGSPQPPA